MRERGKGKKFVAAPGQTFLLTYQDWEDVHLVGTKVVVQEVSLSSICHKEAVPERLDTNLIWHARNFISHTCYAALMCLKNRFTLVCYEFLPQLQPLCRVAVGDGDEPPPLPRRVEVPSPLASDPRRGPRPVQSPSGAARDDHCCGQVDELVVLHLRMRWNYFYSFSS